MTDDPEDDPLYQPPPPNALAVARRAVVLAAVFCRANMELYEDEVDRRVTTAALPDRIEQLGLWPYVEPDEEKLLRAPLDSLSRFQRVQGTWRVEGLAILCWALRRLDFPPHDTKVSNAAVTDALTVFSPDAEDLLATPGLRSKEEIDACREWFYSIHWQVRHAVRQGGDELLPEWIGKYVDALGLPRDKVMLEGRVAFQGKPLSEATKETLEKWESVICERHRAAIWLKGSDEPYTEISVDT